MTDQLSAWQLILSGDAALFAIVWLSLAVSLSAVVLAALAGMPLGALLALTRFPGRSVLVVLLNALMGLPPVVVGLAVYLLLSRSGPLGGLGILFTPTAMVIAQTILIVPIIAALTRQTIEDLWAEYRDELTAMDVSPIAVSSSRYSAQRSSMVWRVSAAMIGTIRMVWAITMAVGVNKMPNPPSGPDRDSRRYTASPTTTGGSPISALSSTTRTDRPGKRVSASSAPKGIPASAASTTADRLTASESHTIANSAASPLRISCQALSWSVIAASTSLIRQELHNCQLIEQEQIYAYKCRMEFLTTSEAAEYVRLGERKLYELVTAGAIPCSKVAGKWLFPRHELDLWVLSGLARPAGMVAADPPPIVGGSQDDLLEWSLRESGSGLASLAEGTARGVDRLLRGEAVAAAVHFHSPVLSEDTPDANIAAVRTMPGLH